MVLSGSLWSREAPFNVSALHLYWVDEDPISPEVGRIMIEGYRKMSAARKLQIRQELINAACLLAF